MPETTDLGSYARWEAPAYLIAEAGVNHGADLERALMMVDLAAEGGVDAIKFQTYKAARIASKVSVAYWDTTFEPARNQFELFSKYDRFGEAEYAMLARRCEERGIAFLSTPFDVDCVDWLDPLVPMFKIASADITNFMLLEKVASKRKPVLLSTGASTIGEIEEALVCLESNGAGVVAVLHCTLSYPTGTNDANVAAIEDIRARFRGRPIGYSVHTVPKDSFAAIGAAYALGARIIEKHFTFDKTLPGNDHYHAFNSEDFRRLRGELELLHRLLGPPRKSVLAAEQAARTQARRSIVAREAIATGSVISEAMLDVKRPGTGIPPKYLDRVVGLVAKRAIGEDEPLQWEMLRT